jgi:plastocyanin
VPKREWRWLVQWVGGLLFVGTALVGLKAGDTETLVIAGLLLAANVALHVGKGTVGLIGLWLLAFDVAFWLTPALVSNLTNSSGLHGIFVPGVLATLAWILLVAAGWAFSYRREPNANGGPVMAVLVGVLAVAGLTAVGLASDRNGPQEGDVEVDLADTRFDPDHLEVPAGSSAFFVENEDLFWHTFTIEGTDVDVRVASRGTHRVEADLEPGTYELVCTIPGHESVGMTGTVEVTAQG